MNTAAPAIEIESAEDSNSLSQTALAVTLFAPRQVRRGFRSARAWARAKDWRAALGNAAWYMLCAAIVVVSFYIMYAVMAAMYAFSPALVYGVGIYYALCVTAGVLFIVRSERTGTLV